MELQGTSWNSKEVQGTPKKLCNAQQNENMLKDTKALKHIVMQGIKMDKVFQMHHQRVKVA